MNAMLSLAPEWERIDLLGACLSSVRRGSDIPDAVGERLQTVQHEVQSIRQAEPWLSLVAEHGLEPLDQDILACSLAPQAEPRLVWMYQELQSGVVSPFPTPALIRETDWPTDMTISITAQNQDWERSRTSLLLALSLVAFLSAVAVFQVVTVALEEEPIGKRIGRPRLVLSIGIIESVLMTYPAWNPEIIGTLDLIIGSGFMVTGGLLAILAITWSFNRAGALAQIFNDEQPGLFYSLVFLWMRYVIPLALIAILGGTIFGALNGE